MVYKVDNVHNIQLKIIIKLPVRHCLYTQFIRPSPFFMKVTGSWLERLGHTLQARSSKFSLGLWQCSMCLPSFYLTSPHLKSSPMQVLHHCALHTMQSKTGWSEGLEMRLCLGGSWVNKLIFYSQLSSSHLLWDQAVKRLMGKLSKPMSQLRLATVTQGEPLTHNIIL